MRQDGGYAIGDKVPMGKAIVYSLQHLMAFVGGGAIVPAMIMGLNPALAVFCQLRRALGALLKKDDRSN